MKKFISMITSIGAFIALCVTTPFLGIFLSSTMICIRVRIARFKLKYSDINWFVVDELIWLAIAVASIFSLPTIVAVAFIVWRMYKLYKVLYIKEVLYARNRRHQKAKYH